MSDHEHEFYYYPDANEEGWRCGCGHQPGEPEGFSPELDRSRIGEKVSAVLQEMHEAKLVYISN